MNNWTAIGNITTDLELKGDPNFTRKQYVNGVLAVLDPFDTSQTDFFRFVVFGTTAANMVRWLSKGNRIGVEGRVKNDNYTDKNGVKHYGTKVIIERWYFADGKRKGSVKEETPPDDDYDIGDGGFPF